MPYAIMAFVVILGLGGWTLHNWSYDSGWDANKAEVLQVKNAELALLNQENIDLINNSNLQRAEDQAKAKVIGNVYRGKIKANRDAHDLALNQYGNTVRVLLNDAQNARKDEADRKRAVVTSFINGFNGTEGGKLTPETRRDLELLSIDGDETAILFGLCQAVAEEDRK